MLFIRKVYYDDDRDTVMMNDDGVNDYNYIMITLCYQLCYCMSAWSTGSVM